MTIDKQLSRMVPVGIILLLGLTGCPGECVQTAYTFAVTATFSPDKDSVRVGDTLFLRSSFSSQLRDLRTNTIADYSNASAIGSNLLVDELTGVPPYIEEAITSFNYVSLQGQIYTDQSAGPNRVKQLRYQERGTTYELASAIIPLRKGLYALSVTDGLSSSISGQPCSRAAFQMTLLSNKRNLSYLQIAANRPLNRNDSLHFYVVKVY